MSQVTRRGKLTNTLDDISRSITSALSQVVQRAVDQALSIDPCQVVAFAVLVDPCQVVAFAVLGTDHTLS